MGRINDSEKIERMREIIKNLSHSLGMAQTQIHNLRRNLKNHIHFNDKVMLVKEAQEYDDSNQAGLTGLVGTATLSNQNYF